MTDEQYNNLVSIISLKNNSHGMYYYVDKLKKNLPEDLLKSIDLENSNQLISSDDDLDRVCRKIFSRTNGYYLYWNAYYSGSYGHKDFTDSLVSYLNKDKDLANKFYEEFFVTKKMMYGCKHHNMKAYAASVLIRTRHPIDNLLSKFLLNPSRYARATKQVTLLKLYISERNLQKDIKFMSRLSNLSNARIAILAGELSDRSIIPYLLNTSNNKVKNLLEIRLMNER